MRVLFAGRSHLPLVGGTQLTTHHLARALAARGHAVRVLALRRPGEPGADADEDLGYRVERAAAPEDALAGTLAAFRPDALVLGGLEWDRPALARDLLARAGGVPTVLYVHDLRTAAQVPELPPPGALAAVSPFAAAHLPGDPAVLPPIVERARYAVPTARETVLFVNPRRSKGLDLAASLARARPDVPFEWVGAWALTERALEPARRAAETLPNVVYRAPVLSPAELYGRTRLVLLPSREPETFGRVAAEAQAAGIPALATDAGGLREVVGDAGRLLPLAAGPPAWAAALGALWDDPEAYAVAARRAADRSRDPARAPERVAVAFEALVARL